MRRAALLVTLIACGSPAGVRIDMNIETSALSEDVAALELTAFKAKTRQGATLDCETDRSGWLADPSVIVLGGPTVIAGDGGDFVFEADGQDIVLDLAAYAATDATGAPLATACAVIPRVAPRSRRSADLVLVPISR